MPYLQEIKAAITILAVVILYIWLIQPRLRAAKLKILDRYLKVQSASLNMQDKILNYVLKNDAMHDELLPGVTFKMYLRDLQKKHSIYLSDKQYKKLKKQNVILFYLYIVPMLKKQDERLKIVKQELSTLDFPQRVAVNN